MKRLLALLLFAALLTGCAGVEKPAPAAVETAASGETEAAETPETKAAKETETAEAPEAAELSAARAAEPDPAAAENDFAAAVEAQAFAVAMCYFEGAYFPDVTPADLRFRWDAAGWYAAWLWRTQDADLLSHAQVRDFQRSIGYRDAEEPAADWLEHDFGARVLKSADGSLNFDFSGHKAQLENLLGVTAEWQLEAEEPEAEVTLRRHYSLNAVEEQHCSLSFTRSRDADSAFSYSLRHVRAPEQGPTMDPALGFTWAELLAANSLENILSIYPSVKITNSYEEDRMAMRIFLRGGELCVMRGWEGYSSGHYRGCTFEYEQTQDGTMRVRVSAIDEGADTVEARNAIITDYLSGAAVMQLDRIDGDLIRTHTTYTGDWLQELAVDRGTLVLRELSHRIDELTPPVVNSFCYTEPAPAFTFLDGWEKPLRKVTLVWESYYGGTREVRTETVELPADWEYIPWEGRWGDYTIYMNEGYTQSYAYPGDGTDYTLWLTTAKG